MTVKAFRKVRGLDEDVDKFQQNVAQVLDSLKLEDSVLNSVQVEAVIGTTDTEIEHKLNKVPAGFLVIDIDKSAIIHRVSKDSRVLVLQSSVADTSVKLLVF